MSEKFHHGDLINIHGSNGKVYGWARADPKTLEDIPGTYQAGPPPEWLPSPTTDLEAFKAMLDRAGANHFVKSTPGSEETRKTLVLYCGAYDIGAKAPHFHFMPDGSFDYVDIQPVVRP